MDTQYDAFTEGVALGGMRTKNDVRILLCYILKSLNAPFSKALLNEVLQTTALANFFEVNDALAALNEGGLVELTRQSDDDYYQLTESGRVIAERLETDLPRRVRETAVAAAMELLSRQRVRYGTSAELTRLEQGYHVTLTIRDGDTVMLQTVLYAADSLQANAIAEAFSTDPHRLYSGVIESLQL